MRICISGITGKMGKEVLSEAIDKNIKVISGIGRKTASLNGIPVFPDPFSLPERPDCIIDFSHPSLTLLLLGYAEMENVPLVIGTTGLPDETEKALEKTGKRLPLFYRKNLAYLFSAFEKLCIYANQLMPTEEKCLTEIHHSTKKDAPSGTAKELSELLGIAQIHSVRIGNVTGEHEIVFASENELVSLKHTALSRRAFAAGAVSAAITLINSRHEKT